MMDLINSRIERFRNCSFFPTSEAIRLTIADAQWRICFTWTKEGPPMSKSSNTTEKNLPPIHPGRILLEDMRDEEISINGLAQAIRVPANRISLIVNEKRGITADTAARLGRYFGTSAQYWLNIQNRFDLDSIDQTVIERDVLPKQAA